MIKTRSVFACAVLMFSCSANATLLFSEYVEGTSYNKALELYNTGELIDFSTENYVVDIYTNGSTAPRYSINLSGVINEDDTFVIGHTSAVDSITSIADLLTGSLSFNGDDAITLSYNGVIVDRIGQIGVDPGSEWGTGDITTQNQTLRRDASVIAGDPDALLAFDPGLQWQGYASDDFTGLGSHAVVQLPTDSADGSVSVPLPGSGALIAAGLLPLLLGAARPKNNTQTAVVA